MSLFVFCYYNWIYLGFIDIFFFNLDFNKFCVYFFLFVKKLNNIFDNIVSECEEDC